MAFPNIQDQSPAYSQTVEEITKLYKSLPPRPSTEEADAAFSIFQSVNSKAQQRLDDTSNRTLPQDVPPELFSVLQELKKTMVLFESLKQRKDSMLLLEIHTIYETFDQLIVRASELVSGDAHVEKKYNFESPDGEIGKTRSKEDDANRLLKAASSVSSAVSSVKRGDKSESLSLMKVAVIIEKSAEAEVEVLDLQAKLMDQVEWIPLSLGKLSNLVELNLADNQIMALPSTIGSLKALKKLDVHANQIINLPDSFGELWRLTEVDIQSNRLRTLPPSFGKLSNLVDLDLSSNQFTNLPDVIGSLTSLKRLNVENNELEELPDVIGSCSSLVELRLDFNRLRALPEAIGKLQCLEILTLHYNRIKRLPATMGELLHLKEFDVSFNELEALPDSLCSNAASLKKLNVGKNFVDLQALPDAIGNLEMLEELDITYNQIRILPDSFRFLVKLKVFRADFDLLLVPPGHVAEVGPEAVVEYMADFVAKRDVKRSIKKCGFWVMLSCCFGVDI